MIKFIIGVVLLVLIIVGFEIHYKIKQVNRIKRKEIDQLSSERKGWKW